MYTKEMLDKFNFLHSNTVNNEIYDYLSSHFNDLEIEILGDYTGSLMELMAEGLLEGWCWQTTETAILFLNDGTYIERGNLKFNKYTNYYHSWIVFNYQNQEYVFDPCLQFLCEKNIYYKVFEIDVLGKTTAEKVREYFFNYISNPPKRDYNCSLATKKFMDYFFNKYMSNGVEDEIVIRDKEDPNAPMYRNNVGYKTTLENGKIKKLVAHYYMK